MEDDIDFLSPSAKNLSTNNLYVIDDDNDDFYLAFEHQQLDEAKDKHLSVRKLSDDSLMESMEDVREKHSSYSLYKCLDDELQESTASSNTLDASLEATMQANQRVWTKQNPTHDAAVPALQRTENLSLKPKQKLFRSTITLDVADDEFVAVTGTECIDLEVENPDNDSKLDLGDGWTCMKKNSTGLEISYEKGAGCSSDVNRINSQCLVSMSDSLNDVFDSDDEGAGDKSDSSRLGVQENEALEYIKHSHRRLSAGFPGLAEIKKNLLSPIIERKVSATKLQTQDTAEKGKEKFKNTTIQKFGSFLMKQKSLSKERIQMLEGGEDSRKTRSNPNIEKMIKDLLIGPNLSEDRLTTSPKPPQRSHSLKVLLTRLVSGEEKVKHVKSKQRSASDTDDSYANHVTNIEIDFAHNAMKFDGQDCEWNDVCFSPRLDKRRKERFKCMRRNSSPEFIFDRDFNIAPRLQAISKENKKSSRFSFKKKSSLKKLSSTEDTKSPESSSPKMSPKITVKKIKGKSLGKSLSTSELFNKGKRQESEERQPQQTMRLFCRLPRKVYTTKSWDESQQTRKKKVPMFRSVSEHQRTPKIGRRRRNQSLQPKASTRLSRRDLDYFERLQTKKSSFHRKKQNSKEADEEVEQINPGPVDPVYSLLKCAADLPRSGGKSPCLQHAHCSGQHGASYTRFPSGGDSSGNTSKTSSPSSSASHSPKTRRKKLNARMKSFSLDTPEPPKQLLGIDESTKKKSSSFTNTCFGGKESPEEKSFSAASLRKKFAFAKASSLEMDEKKRGSYSPSPKESPKSQRKEKGALHVALYNFKAKEKDDIDLRAGWRVQVTDSSKKDWWKGKSHGKSGYFPATYVIPILPDQRVFQVLQPLTLADGNFTNKFHKDQIVLKVDDGPTEEIIMIRAANNRQALCPLEYLNEL